MLSWWFPSISLAWRFSSQSLIPYASLVVLSAATSIIEEGIRLRFDASIDQKHLRGRQTLYSRIKLTIRRIRWRRKKKKEHLNGNGFAFNAAMKDTKLAKRRLLLARAAFKSAEAELRAAERGMRHAR